MVIYPSTAINCKHSHPSETWGFSLSGDKAGLWSLLFSWFMVTFALDGNSLTISPNKKAHYGLLWQDRQSGNILWANKKEYPLSLCCIMSRRSAFQFISKGTQFYGCKCHRKFGTAWTHPNSSIVTIWPVMLKAEWFKDQCVTTILLM